MSDPPPRQSDPIVVIVVEDDVLIRMVAADALAAAGLSVVEAEHADAALAHLNAKADGVHVVFTDVHMPGRMNGLQLAHHVRGHWPWIGLLVASGDVQPTSDEMPAGSRFLPKPYRHELVLNLVRELAAD